MKRVVQQFKVGDKVSWMSQAGGRSVVKVGRVAGVIPAGLRPVQVLGTDLLPQGRARRMSGLPRKEESYVVRAANQRTKRNDWYWPRTWKLSLVGPHSDVHSRIAEGAAV